MCSVSSQRRKGKLLKNMACGDGKKGNWTQQLAEMTEPDAASRLIGPPDVGKTAIREGLASRIVAKEVPESPRTSASATRSRVTYGGQYEEKFTALMRDIEDEAICFIDKVHTLVNLGKAEGSNDAGQVIKAALARGLQLVGAMTPDEYRKTLGRRFQPVQFGEPTVESTILIPRGLKPRYEAYHGVETADSALVTAALYSAHYIPARYLPDKAIHLVDAPRAASRTAPKPERLECEIMTLLIGQERAKRAEDEQLTAIWQNERARLDRIKDLKKRLTKSSKSPGGRATTRGAAGAQPTRSAIPVLGADGRGEGIYTQYHDRHTISRLIGYVGFEEGGQMTEAVRRTLAVIPIDEPEKAHKDVAMILLQILDGGNIADSQGRTVDFKNTIICPTSSLGSDVLTYSTSSDASGILISEVQSLVMDRTTKYSAPEPLGRLSSILILGVLGGVWCAGDCQDRCVVPACAEVVGETISRDGNVAVDSVGLDEEPLHIKDNHPPNPSFQSL
ncbi:P-loop containing nucleoside triphosphate hydrolase protein [Hygrophoropsis aurantiaca]|uniref:P-loop containing nucleoside triphosphate hydrolase protein n=1 Tax=Hygrophoropsis aurantiaca TaxID=72124 RepID=A0ACB7ZXX5_9AGAM|nr:P-loop containing nucleoside triphosphate hydrolase protein [Hygrophoropsis aurantiaca]